jgi:toluene monooxygenase electron transfer component
LWPEAPGSKVCRNVNETLLCQSAADGPVDLALRSTFTQPCDPPCGVTAGKISRTHMLTPDISLFAVTLEKPVSYRPGQFVLLSGMGIDGPRAYSMTQYPPQNKKLNFLIRKDATGSFTGALFGAPSVPRDVTVFGPLGRATFSSDEDRPIVMIAGGSGIAGILAILDHAMAEDHFSRHPSQVFFGLRDASSSYLLDELSSAASRAKGKLKVTIAFSDAPCPEEFVTRYPSLEFAEGFLHDIVRSRFGADGSPALQDMKNPLFFVAGPPLMVNATMRVLVADCKISPTEIRYDRFG